MLDLEPCHTVKVGDFVVAVLPRGHEDRFQGTLGGGQAPSRNVEFYVPRAPEGDFSYGDHGPLH